jgi:hypothetical protein
MLTPTDNTDPQAIPPTAGRAGRYVQQPTGYRAFIPAPLPPVPPIAIDAEMQQCLSAADRAVGRLDGSIHTLPDPDLFVLMYIRKEAVLSSQIEGTQSSLTDVLKAEGEIFDPDTPRDVGEVLNYIAAMNQGLARLKELPVSLRLIREIHARLMQGVRPASSGAARTGSVPPAPRCARPRSCRRPTMPPKQRSAISSASSTPRIRCRRSSASASPTRSSKPSIPSSMATAASAAC